VAGLLLGCGSRATSSAAPTTNGLISRGVPVFASSQLHPAKYANDADYGTVWRGSVPGWIAYDLSRIAPARRGRVLLAWFNDPITSPYDHTIAGEPAYNSLRDYTVEVNAARGGKSAPTSGWVTRATVQGNHYHSREHLIDLKGYNWIRVNVTAGDGSPENDDAALNLDVYDAGKHNNSWLFLGDSITMEGMHHQPVAGTPNLSQLIGAARPRLFPAFEDGGTGFLQSGDGASRINTWLATFPGKYVGLSFGTNDANNCVAPATFYANYVTMVRAVLRAKKIPVVPTIPWARSEALRRCAPRLNGRLTALRRAYRQIVKGPDLWSYFRAHQGLISADNLHPSPAGYAAYRRQWAKALLTTVYPSHSKQR